MNNYRNTFIIMIIILGIMISLSTVTVANTPIILSNDTAMNAPGVASFNGALFIAWADNNKQLNIESFNASSGASLGKLPLPALSSIGATLCAFQGSLYLAWPSTPNGQLCVMSSTNGKKWGTPVRLDYLSASRRNLLYFKII